MSRVSFLRTARETVRSARKAANASYTGSCLVFTCAGYSPHCLVLMLAGLGFPTSRGGPEDGIWVSFGPGRARHPSDRSVRRARAEASLTQSLDRTSSSWPPLARSPSTYCQWPTQAFCYDRRVPNPLRIFFFSLKKKKSLFKNDIKRRRTTGGESYATQAWEALE